MFGGAVAAYSPRTFFKADVAPTLILLGDRDLASLLDQVPPAIDELVALGAPVEFATLAGKDHDHVVLDFDSDADAMTPLLVDFITRVAP